MARIYSNENFPQPAVAELRRLGHDALTVMEVGAVNQAIPDDEVLAYATAQNRVLLTLNRQDFIRMHRANPNHAGIIVCTFDVDFIPLAKRIHAAIEAEGGWVGKLLRVNRQM